MPQSEAKFQINQFNGGLNTDSSPLASSGPVALDEDNCELLTNGGRRRRRGLRLEPGAVVSASTYSAGSKEDNTFDQFEWNNVAEQGGLNFLVVQTGAVLRFYDKGIGVLSQAEKSFTVNLNSFKAPTASTTQVATSLISVASGKGVLFVCGERINPFYIEYNEGTDSITTRRIHIKIRDFEEQSPDLGPTYETTTPTREFLYDLYNQGWYQTGLRVKTGSGTVGPEFGGILLPATELYRTDVDDSFGFYPRKNTQWHVGKQLVVPASDPEDALIYLNTNQVRSSPSGNTLSPFGHYILELFAKDRGTVTIDTGFSGTGDPYLSTLPIEYIDERPNSIEFYAGRVWYLLGNTLYYSQLLDADTLDKAEKCYQEGDPTSEGESDIVATDGGELPIPSMGAGQKLKVIENTLVIVADNGVWSVSGPEGQSFTATDFVVTKLTNNGSQSPRSVVEAEGLLFFWSDTSIFVVKPGDIRSVLQVEDLIEQRITEFYNDIPQSCKRNAKGIYNPITKTAHWLYASAIDVGGNQSFRFRYDRMLNFALKFSAFYPYSFPANDDRYVMGATVSGGFSSTYVEDTVVDNNGAIVFDNAGNRVTSRTLSTNESDSVLKLWAMVDDATSFYEFRELSFVDFIDYEVSSNVFGVDYSSFIHTFYHIQDDYMAMMQAPYIYTYFKRTEDFPESGGDISFTINNISPGGVTFNPSVLGSRGDGTNPPVAHGNSAFLVGEDGNFYAIPDSANIVNARLYSINLGTDVFNKSSASLQTDAISIGVVPHNGWGAGGSEPCVVLIPHTPYFMVMWSTFSGVTVRRHLLYYKVVSAASVIPVAGLTVGDNDVGAQFSPDEDNTAVSAVGWAGGVSTAGVNSSVYYTQPIVLAYRGENRSTIFTCPSINYMLANTPIIDATANGWKNHEINLNSVSDWDSNMFYVADCPTGLINVNRSFVLPTATGAVVVNRVWYDDLFEHDAGTETTTSSYLSGIAGTYIGVGGVLTSMAVTVAPAANAFGHTCTVATGVAQVLNGTFNYPFADLPNKYDDTAGDEALNYYSVPCPVPSVENDVSSPWFLLWPRHYREDGDDKLACKVQLYDPSSFVVTDVDFIKGQVYTEGMGGVDAMEPHYAGMYWDRNTYDLYAFIYGVEDASPFNRQGVAVQFGSFEPSWLSTSESTIVGGEALTYVQSGCQLRVRWEWANHANSGKISPAVEVYRPGRFHPVTDPLAPEVTGLPVVVSKTKMRGRGRVLQLQYNSETGKDFQLYGWAVWAGKNTRF